MLFAFVVSDIIFLICGLCGVFFVKEQCSCYTLLMNIADILSSVEKSIKSPEERAYFLIHEARYLHILKEIEKLTNEARGALANSGSSPKGPERKRGIEEPLDLPKRPRRLRILAVGC